MSAIKTTYLDAGRLRVEFERVSDRWVHRIGILDADIFTPVVESVEGTADDIWPTSPPLQEIHFESHGESHIAFLVGHGQRNHWSLSIEASKGTGSLLFDVAARIPNAWASGIFCSVYRPLAGPPVDGDFNDADTGLVECGWIGWNRGARIDRCQQGRLYKAADGGAIIEPCDNEMDLPMTMRWRYKFSFSQFKYSSRTASFE